MNGELRIGLVGGGRLAELGYLPAAEAACGVRLVAVAEPDPARRDRIAGLAGGIAAYPDAGSLLAAGKLDGLVLASPAPAHLADARLAAAAGLPVLVEKPPAPDLQGAAELAALSPAPRIAFNRRFDPGLVALRAAVPAGADVTLDLELGYRRQGWGAYAVADDALLDLGPHLIDLARWITGAEVTAVEEAVLTHEHAEFRLRLGAAEARLRCATDRPHREEFTAHTRGGDRLGRVRHGGLAAAVIGRLLPGRPNPLVATLTAQLEAYGRTIRGVPETVLGTASDGVAVMRAVEAVRACAAPAGDQVKSAGG